MKYFTFLTLSALLLTEPLSAYSIGKEGNPFVSDGISWQKVYFDNDETGFTAVMPGSPVSGISQGFAYCYSDFEGVKYEIKISLNQKLVVPDSAESFLNELNQLFGAHCQINLLKNQDPNVKYTVELKLNSNDKIGRFLVSHNNALYTALVAGDNLSFAEQFLESIVITK